MANAFETYLAEMRENRAAKNQVERDSARADANARRAAQDARRNGDNNSNGSS